MVSTKPTAAAQPAQQTNVSKEIPAGVHTSSENNYHRADGQNCGNFIMAQMHEVQSQHTSESNSSVDPLSVVIGAMRPGRTMLYGRGVTPTDLKHKPNMTESSVNIPKQLIQSMKTKWQEEEERDEILAKIEVSQAHLELLKRTNVLNDAFPI